MAVMGRYCKAYPIEQLEAYPSWQEHAQPIEKDTATDDTSEDERELAGKIVYLQENYVVTRGIYKDEGIIFDAVSDAWKQFCTEQLEFVLPKELYEDIELPDTNEASDKPA